MTRHLARCVLLSALCLVAGTSSADAPHAVAGVAAVYDTVDAVEVSGNLIVVTGIIVGQSSQSEFSYAIADAGSTTSGSGGANRCDRLALLAIAKPGKYQFATTVVSEFFPRFGCKLIVRTP